MAILREGIVAANDCMGQIKTATNELSSISNEMMAFFNNNANFQLFKQGTNRGEAIYNELNKLVTIVVDELVPAINKLSMNTSALIEKQEKDNRASSEDFYKTNTGNMLG